MDLLKVKVIIIVTASILALFVASPAISRILIQPQTNFYTELWILNSAHSANNYPYNVLPGDNYTIYLDIANHIGYCGYYLVEVKLRNDVMPYPGSWNDMPVNLPSLYNLTAFVPDESNFELPLTFSFNFTPNSTCPQINFNRMVLNGVFIDLTGYSTTYRNEAPNGYFGNVYFELWLYNRTTGEFQYNDRYVNLPLNMRV
jgi:hypothetical protein